MNLASLVDIPSLIAPDAVGLRLANGASLDYATLRPAVGRGAGYLASLGVSPGDRVGLFGTFLRGLHERVRQVAVEPAACGDGAVGQRKRS